VSVAFAYGSAATEDALPLMEAEGEIVIIEPLGETVPMIMVRT